MISINKDKKQSLGLTMIVKDGAETVANAILSASDICDQIVVVDTGSSDETESICARLGAELYYYLWGDDFSKARNFALSFVRTDWILSLDADEEISFGLEQINHLLDDEKIGGINLVLSNLLSDGPESPRSEHRYTRIFRRNKIIRYKGQIHEQIRESIEEAGYLVIDTDIVINHYGYIDASDEKKQRNKEMLEREISNDPDDPFIKYHLAETEFSMSNLDKAKFLFEECLEDGYLSEAQIEISKMRLAQIALSEGKIDNVKSHLQFFSSDPDREGSRQYILAAGFLSEQKFDKAKKLYLSPVLRESKLVDQNEINKYLSSGLFDI